VIRLLVSIWTELLGLFVDDGALAVHCVALIAFVAFAVLVLSLPPVAGGLMLLIGCIGILAASINRAARAK